MAIAIYGLGNVLLGDDAVGPAIVEIISKRWELPDTVIVQDLGTPSLDLTEYITGKDCVIFVDAVEDSGGPGTVLTYDREAILRHPPGLRLSPHDPSLKDTLISIEFTGNGPREVMMVGIVARQTEIGGGLSAEVREAIPRALDILRYELTRRGVTLTERYSEEEPKFWWA
jgi:hydrogenase maturation protease